MLLVVGCSRLTHWGSACHVMLLKVPIVSQAALIIQMIQGMVDSLLLIRVNHLVLEFFVVGVRGQGTNHGMTTHRITQVAVGGLAEALWSMLITHDVRIRREVFQRLVFVIIVIFLAGCQKMLGLLLMLLLLHLLLILIVLGG